MYELELVQYTPVPGYRVQYRVQYPGTVPGYPVPVYRVLYPASLYSCLSVVCSRIFKFGYRRRVIAEVESL